MFFYFYLFKETRLDVLCEFSDRQSIHMKYQVLFSPKNNEKIFMYVVCLYLLPLFQEGQLSVTGESMCTKYWLTA